MCSAAFRSAIRLAQIGALEHPPQALVPRLFGIFAITAATPEKIPRIRIWQIIEEFCYVGRQWKIYRHAGFCAGQKELAIFSKLASFEGDGVGDGQASPGHARTK